MKSCRIPRALMLALVALLFLAAGCGGAPAGQSNTEGSQGETAEGVTLTLWSRDDGQAVLEPVLAAYNASHSTQIKATFIPSEQFVQKFAAAVAGGEAPDLIAVDLIYMPSFSAAGQMTDITEKARALPFFDQLSPSHMRLGTYNDKIYSLPFNAEGSVLIYNKNLFREAGLDPERPPATLAEISEYAAKISALGDDTYGFYFSGACAGCNAFTVLPYIWASGGDVLSEDGTQATLNDPSVKAVLEWLRQMWVDKNIPESARVDSGTEFLNAFTTGKIGMAGTGAFSIAALKNDHPDIDFGIAPLPGLNGGTGSFAGGDTIAIPAGSQHVDEAFEFMSWYLSEEVQLEHVAKNNNLTLRLDLVENQYSQQDERYVTVANAMYEAGRTPYVLRYNEIFNDANGPWLAMLQKAVFDGQVDAAINDAQQQITTILSQE